MRACVLLALGLTAVTVVDAVQQDGARGVRLEHHPWTKAEALLTPDAVVVIPLGAALKEHGPHLALRNDLTLAEYFTRRVEAAAGVVITPPLTYHFYPAFLEYPGSTSLTLETARDMTVQVVRSLARYGPRRFYVLNTGISTSRPLAAAAAALAQDGVLLRYTDFGAAAEQAAARIKQQPLGSHADEIETSMMLYIEPAAVDMALAARETSPAPSAGPMRLNRQPGRGGVYSPSGVWGDATLATAAKGRIVVDAVLSTLLADIESVRTAPLPAPQAQPAAPAAAAAERPPVRTEPLRPSGCTAGDERAIHAVAAAFNLGWATLDAEALSLLWSTDGDIVHLDGVAERGRVTIRQNRAEQFRQRQYRGSRHSLAFGVVRCVTRGVAVVDAKWELRGVVDAAGQPLPVAEGLATLVMQRAAEGWLIEAYRYNVKPGTPPPSRPQTKPGHPDKR